jgi:hypothetical protein
MTFKDLIYLIYFACLFLSAVTASIYWKSLKSRQLFLFVPFLCCLFIQEVGAYIYRNFAGGSTELIYNLYRPLLLCVLTWFFYHIPFNKPSRKLILGMFFIYIAIISVTFAFLHSAFKYNSYLSLAAGIIITSCGLISLFNYFNLDNAEEEKKWQPITWIATGVVIYYPIVNISFAFYNHITKYNAVIFGMLLYNAVPVIMSIFMYGCFTYAFYLCKKKI